MEINYCFVTLACLSCLMVVSGKIQFDNSVETGAEIPSDIVEHAGLKDWMFERLIRRALEAYKRLMKKGDPSKNIPVLDPLYSAKDTAQFNDSDGLFDLRMESFNTTTTGLSDFDINSVSASMFSLKADIDLTFNDIRRKGTYIVKASLFNDVDVLYGQGKLDEGVQNLNVLIHLEFGLSMKQMYVKKVAVNYNLQSGTIKLDGLLNGSQLGKTVSQVLSDGSSNFANKNRARILPYVDAAAKKRVSRLIDGMTLSELISYLQALIDA